MSVERRATDCLRMHFTYLVGIAPVKPKLRFAGVSQQGQGEGLLHGILVARGTQGQYVKEVCRDRDRRQVDKMWAMPSYLYGG